MSNARVIFLRESGPTRRTEKTLTRHACVLDTSKAIFPVQTSSLSLTPVIGGNGSGVLPANKKIFESLKADFFLRHDQFCPWNSRYEDEGV
jgi:hypothetical protein